MKMLTFRIKPESSSVNVTHDLDNLFPVSRLLDAGKSQLLKKTDEG